MTSKSKESFRLNFSNRVIEHLGIKLYQNRPTNVVAEFLSNSWDADAEKVTIDLKATDASTPPSIIVTDDGKGMTREEIIHEFLIIGRNRRKSPADRTQAGRAPMGRKGIGKLAGFGIAGAIDVLSAPNFKRRVSQGGTTKIYWLRFHLKEITDEASIIKGGYSPEVMADGLNINEFEALLNDENVSSLYEEFKKSVLAGEGGVCIRLHDLTLKKAINPDSLLRSLGNRFTVTMLRPDFSVKVNGKSVAPVDAFPPFQDFGYGNHDAPLIEKISLNGGDEREIRYWIKFVSLPDSDWSIEDAGIGVYAHGKIAQDRPFFFGVKGKEIFSRYLYGVVEADWLDEMQDDVVSTDRRSINWDTDATALFYKWGAEKLAEWIAGFEKWRKNMPKKKIIDRIRKQSLKSSLTGAEEDALAGLLSEIIPSLGNDEEAISNATTSITAAWTHEPTRKLTKDLWEKVFSAEGQNANAFTMLIEQLHKSLVPEALGLAVTLAQRIAAITAMKKLIEMDKTETHLQRLVEQFPWLLGPAWDKLTANQTIKTLVGNKFKPDEDSGEWPFTPTQGSLKPDFVFLADAGLERDIVVFELKGPEGDKTLQPHEYRQLSRYLDIIGAAYPNINVRGILIGHDKGGFKENRKDIEIIIWADVLMTARALHVSYLASLLRASEPAATDDRLRQISDFGGKETMELLKRFEGVFQDIVAFPPTIKSSLQK